MIINPDVQNILEQIPGTLYGQALTAYLEQARSELNDINKVHTFEELLGKQYAIKVIDDLFKLMENRKTEARPKNQYI